MTWAYRTIGRAWAQVFALMSVVFERAVSPYRVPYQNHVREALRWARFWPVTAPIAFLLSVLVAVLWLYAQIANHWRS